MSGKFPHRDVGPFLQKCRELWRGRKHVTHIRFADDLAARNQPPPDIPGGPYHRISKVNYYSRDARRLIVPPEIIVGGAKQLSAGSSVSTELKTVTPNAVYNPRLGEPPKPVSPEESYS